MHQFEIHEGSPCSLARRLIAEGKADRSDRLVMLRSGVGWYADRTIVENAKVGPRYGRWKPFPDARRHSPAGFSAPEVD